MKLVKVEWSDAYAPGPPWMLEDELPDTPTTNKVAQVGYLIKRTKAGIWICGGYTRDKALNSPFFIPSGMIHNVTEIRK